jgi:hypothetical protein
MSRSYTPKEPKNNSRKRQQATTLTRQAAPETSDTQYNDIIELQRLVGNRQVQRLLAEDTGVERSKASPISVNKTSTPSLQRAPLDHIPPESDDYWALLWTNIKVDMLGWLGNIGRSIESFVDDMGETGSKKELDLGFMSDWIGALLGDAGAIVSAAINTVKSIIDDCGSKDKKVRLADFSDIYRKQVNTYTDQLRDNNKDVLLYQLWSERKENEAHFTGDLQTGYRLKMRSEFGRALQQLRPTPEEFQKLLVTTWMKSTSSYLVQGIPGVPDINGAIVYNVYFDRKSSFDPNSAWQEVGYEKPAIDGVDRAAGVAVALKHAYGEDTYLADLPMAMFVNIFRQDWQERRGTKHTLIAKFYKERRKQLEASANANWQVIKGTEYLFGVWSGEGHQPKVGELEG